MKTPPNTHPIFFYHVDEYNDLVSIANEPIPQRSTIEQRFQHWTDTRVIQFAKALPEIIACVQSSPDGSIDEFLKGLDSIVIAHALSREQVSRARSAYETYQQDRSCVVAYRSLVCGSETTPSAGEVFADIENNPAAKATLLKDVGISGAEQADVSGRFYLENRCPSCFVVRFNGTPDELAKYMRSAEVGRTAGFYYERYVTEPDDTIDQATASRMNLLDRRLIIYTAPSAEQRKRNDMANDPHQTVRHELRHYLTSLFTRGNTPPENDHDYIMSKALDEVQAHVAEGDRSINLDGLLYHRRNGEEIDIGEYDLAVHNICAVAYEITRLTIGGGATDDLIANITALSGNVGDLARRLALLGTSNVPTVRVLESMTLRMPIELRDTRTTNKRARRINHLFYNELINLLPVGNEIGDIDVVEEHIAHKLLNECHYEIGQTPRGMLEVVVEQLSTVDALAHALMQKGNRRTSPFAQVKEKLINMQIEGEAVIRRERLWPDFLAYLQKQNPPLYTLYQEQHAKTGGGSMQSKLAYVLGPRKEIEQLYETWQIKHP